MHALTVCITQTIEKPTRHSRSVFPIMSVYYYHIRTTCSRSAHFSPLALCCYDTLLYDVLCRAVLYHTYPILDDNPKVSAPY